MSQTNWSGPLASGDRPAGYSGGPNLGFVVLTQTMLVNFNGAAGLVQSASINVPYNSQITNIFCDVLTAFNAGTSATLAVGTAVSGTTYASGVDVKTAAGRIAPTFTSAQLTAMASTGTTGPVVATVTSAGTAPLAGQVRVTVQYVQTQSSTD
jgi:hypothetical protein